MLNLSMLRTALWGSWVTLDGVQSDIFTHVQRENRAGCQACVFPKTTLLRPPQSHEDSVRKVLEPATAHYHFDVGFMAHLVS